MTPIEAMKAFAAHYGYDASYMEHMFEAAPAAFEKFTAVNDLAQYRGVLPIDAKFAAGIAGTLFEDCGPCVQLGVKMAEESGMAADQISAVLTRSESAMNEATRTAYRFADALVRDDAQLDEARETARAKWGDAGIVELTLVAQVTRIFPMVKRGLGYAKTCERVSVGGRPVDVVKEAA